MHVTVDDQDPSATRVHAGPDAADLCQSLSARAFTLAGGTTVYLVEQHALPIVSMDLNFAGGAAVDPPGKEGLASVCMAMLTEGTEALDKLAYTERLADVASSIGGYASDDSVGLTLSSLGKHLATTFALFADTLRAPGFRRSDFERLVHRRIEGIRQAKRSPASGSTMLPEPVCVPGETLWPTSGDFPVTWQTRDMAVAPRSSTL